MNARLQKPPRRPALAVSTPVALALALTLTLALGASAGSAAARSAPRTHASDPSRYPAGATRAVIHPRVSQYASAASAAQKKSSKKKHRPKKPVLHGNPARALLGFQAMQRSYYILGSGLYAGEPFSFLWPFSQAMAATISMAHIAHLGVSLTREVHARLIGLGSYLDTDNSGASDASFTSTLPAFDGTVAPPVGPGGAKYYDDNDWVGIELARMYQLNHDPAALAGAQQIMSFEMAGWQTDPTLGCAGGLPFSNAANNTDRNTVTTAPAAELAAQLYRLTGKPEYLQFAEMAYGWVRTCLLQPSGLYMDHVSPTGQVQGSLWSYNQGTMMGAATLLYEATGNQGYLDQARATEAAALAYFTPSRLAAEIPFFPSVYFRNLIYLDSVTHEPSGAKLAQAYADYAWQHRRLSNNLFVAGSPASGQLLVQAAIVQIYALLSSPPSTYF
jgi:Glycosyl hydrolase family 76